MLIAIFTKFYKILNRGTECVVFNFNVAYTLLFREIYDRIRTREDTHGVLSVPNVFTVKAEWSEFIIWAKSHVKFWEHYSQISYRLLTMVCCLTGEVLNSGQNLFDALRKFNAVI